MTKGEEMRECPKCGNLLDLLEYLAPNAPTLEEIVRDRPELTAAPCDDEHLRVWAAMPKHWQNSISPEQLRIAIDAVDAVRAANGEGPLEKLLAHAWGVDVKYNRDNTVRRIVIDVRDTTTSAPYFVEQSAAIVREFCQSAKGAIE
jgi:hypothetical protein